MEVVAAAEAMTGLAAVAVMPKVAVPVAVHSSRRSPKRKTSSTSASIWIRKFG